MLFLQWEGLVAPGVRFVGGSTLEPRHAVLSFGYLGLGVAFIEYRFLQTAFRDRIGRFAIIVLTIVFVSVNGTSYIPAKTMVVTLLGGGMGYQIAGILTGLLIAFAASVLISGVLVSAWKLRMYHHIVGAAFIVLFLGASAAAVVSQFSSRYTVLAFPFLCLLIGEMEYAPSKIVILPRALGILGGLLQYWNYCRTN
jgi:hypothetical protein